MKMGVVADDVTGSNDIGIMFAKSGYLTHVYSYDGSTNISPGSWNNPDAADIVILNTNSRLDPADLAYKKVFEATLALKRAGCRRFHKKTCSVFRGNIGAEFDAMLDALGLEFALVILGFPKNGRTTVDGIHYVHGKKLEDSEFRDDPIHPMKRSDLVEILQQQTKRCVGLLPHNMVERGTESLHEGIEQMRSRFQYVILDVPDQAALTTIAEAVKDEQVLCGSSAIAEELPPVWEPLPRTQAPGRLSATAGMGILIAAGSLMPQTAAQIEYIARNGATRFRLQTSVLLDENERNAHIQDLSAAASACMRVGCDVIIHTPNGPQELEEVEKWCAALGMPKREFSRIVSATLAEVAARILKETQQNRLIVAGGETSDAICKRLGINEMRIMSEIEPGLPSCVSLNEPRRGLVLKSGSFGKEDFFERALAHLRTL